MADIRNLLNQIAAQEAQLRDTPFLAPCVRGGRVRTSVANIIYTFTPQPQDFEGWGIFQSVDEKEERRRQGVQPPEQERQYLPQIQQGRRHQRSERLS